MRVCVFPECRRRPSRKSGRTVSYHRFPREKSMAEEWVKWIRDVCGMYDVVFRSLLSSALCSRHFTEDSFRPSGRLKPDVLPSLTPDDLDNAEKNDSKGNHNPDSLNHNAVKKQLRNSPSSIENTSASNEAQPEIVFVEHEELSDGVIEVPGCDGESSTTLETKPEKKIFLDFYVDHTKTFKKLQRSVKALNSALCKTKLRLHTQSNKVREGQKTVLSIKRIAEALRKEGKITDEGQSELNLAIDHILDHMKGKKAMDLKSG